MAYRGHSITAVLGLSVEEGAELFADSPKISAILALLQEVGLGDLELGQTTTTLSGGEAQRIKLASELQRSQRGATLYVLDEPTTGLHPLDIDRLMAKLGELVDDGNTVVLVEHNMHVVAQADWVIDIGPGAADAGGRVVACGAPREVARSSASRTAPYLSAQLQR